MGNLDFSAAITQTGSVGDHELLRLAWNPYEDVLAICTEEDTILSNSTAGTDILCDFPATSIDWKNDGSILAATDYLSNTVELYNKYGEHVRSLDEDVRKIVYLYTKWNPNGLLLGASGSDGKILIWKALSGEILRDVQFPTEMSIEIFDWNSNSSLAAGCQNGNIYYYNMDEEIEIKTFSGHQQNIVDLKWNSQKTLLASRSEDHTLKLWTLQQTSCIRNIPDYFSRTLEWLPTGHALIALISHSQVYILDIENGFYTKNLTDHTTAWYIFNFSVSPNGTLIAYCSDLMVINILCMNSYKLISTWKSPNRIDLIKWNPSGNKLFISTLSVASSNYYIFDVCKVTDNM